MAVFALVALAILRFFWTYKTARVPEWNDQMVPTLSPGDRLLVHRGILRADQFSRGEMVAYGVEVDGTVSLRVGRVAALPGDTVELSSTPGREVLVNGEPSAFAPVLETPVDSPGTSKRKEEPRKVTTVQPGTLYLVNDNLRSRLPDSRRFGPVDQRAFAGKVVMTTW